ncbi:ABC transporter related protein [alpha proteobacterium BAL199]|nr:ABC transporter related protein [alpha proteobacterium BAL199]
MTVQGEATAVLSVRGLAKRYGAVQALAGVDLDVRPGEVLAICGDNGAGKSTLIKIVSGAETASDGEMRLRGEAVRFASPHDALRRGLATIYQDLALAPRLAIYQNVFMGAELTRGVGPLRVLDKPAMIEQARGYLAQLGSSVTDTTRAVATLSGGQRQSVAIARALRWNADIVVMDEPTAALGVKETAQVLDLIRALNAAGKTVVLISHNMADVVAVAHRVAILKQGRKVIDRPVAGLDADTLSHMVMAGREVA